MNALLIGHQAQLRPLAIGAAAQARPLAIAPAATAVAALVTSAQVVAPPQADFSSDFSSVDFKTT
jgi:hypothetical protein